MSKNHLFIGLGGQGVKSIAALRRLSITRKVQFKELGINDPDNKTPTSQFDYLIIDSNIPNTPKLWESMGEDVSLAQRQIVDIARHKNKTPIKILATQPNIQPWLNYASDLLTDETVTSDVVGAAQQRRLGRLLGAAHAEEIVQAIEGAVTRFGGDTGTAELQCTFHIFASLCGGTGSGTIIDVVSFIRNRFVEKKNFPIYLYLYIAGEYAGNERETSLFYVNQYTTLRDLNAIIVGEYEPDLALLTRKKETLSKTKGENGISQIIISGGNDLPLVTQIDNMAEICFNRVYATDKGALDSIQNAFSVEDKLEECPAEPSKEHPERSYRFAVACVKRWKIPVEACKKNLFYFIYNQLLNRWLYQNWELNEGYKRGEPSQKQTTTLLNILSQNIRNHSSEAKNKYVSEVENAFKEILNTSKKEGWTEQGLYKLERDFNRVINDGHPSEGLLSLSDFVKTQAQQVDDLCETIREKILEETAKAISQDGLVDMLASLKDTKKGFDNKITEEKSRVDPEGKRQDKLKGSLDLRKQEWEKITTISSLFNKHRFLLNVHGEDYLNFFKSKLESEMRGATFALYDAICQMLGKLITYAEETVNKFEKKSKEISNKLEKSNAALEDLKDENSVKYEFDKEDLKNMQKEILNNSDYLMSELSSFDALWESHAKNMYNATAQNGAVDNLFTALEKNADGISIWRTAENLHQCAINNNPKLKSVLYGSLVDRLKDRYTENSKGLTAEIVDFMDKINPSSTVTYSPGLKNNSGQQPPLACMGLGFPTGNDFRTELINVFKDAKPNRLKISNKNYTSYESTDQYEISLLYIQYWMPVRFIDTVKYLAKEYRNLNPIKDEKAKYLANIDPRGENDMQPELTYDPAEEQKGFALDAYWQAKLLSCGDPDHTPIVTYRTDFLGQTNIVRNQFSEGYIGTDSKVLNNQNGICKEEEQYLKEVSMDDIDEIKTLVKIALDRIRDMEEPDRFIEAEKLIKTAASLVEKTPAGSKERENAEKGYNNLVDALKKRNLVIVR